MADRKDGDGTRTDTGEHLATISALVLARTGHDFSKYKEKTVSRRIQHRMQVLQADTVLDYIVRLRHDPKENDLLFRELLIGVTQFFRDPDAFEALQALVIAELVGQRASGQPIRVWVSGCSTGEEAYSTAILLCEAMEQRGIALDVNIFATEWMIGLWSMRGRHNSRDRPACHRSVWLAGLSRITTIFLPYAKSAGCAFSRCTT